MSVVGWRSRQATDEHVVARHRAVGAPTLTPPASPFHHAHLDRRRRLAHIGFWLLAVLAAVAAGAVLGSGHGAGDGTGPAPGVSTPAHVQGAWLEASIGASGGVRLSIEVVLPAEATRPPLAVPARPSSEFHPQVHAGGLVVEAVRLPGDVAGTRITVEYAATGTYVASHPAPPGRGLVLLTPVRLGDPAPLARLQVTDARILNLACEASGEPRPCGSRTGATWVVAGLDGSTDVVAQVDLRG